MSRTQDRKDAELPWRVAWLEQDQDRSDEWRSEVDRKVEAFDRRLGKMLWVLVGILVSVATASIMLALQLAVK